MAECSLYEEQTNDGSIAEQVLAFHNTEFKKRKHDPSYQPSYRIVRNPRKIGEEREKQLVRDRELEVERAILSWGRDNGLVRESAVETPTPQQSPHPSANKPVLQQKVPKDSQTDHSVARAPSKSLKRATQVQLDHIQRFPSLYGLPAHKYKSPVQPQQPPQQRHAWQAVEQQRPLQPKSYPLSSAGSQTRPQTPPLSRSSSGANSPTNTTAPISAPALSSTPTRLPPTQLSTPPAVASEVMRQDSKSPAPVLQWSGYIPGRIWNTVNEIKACKRHTRSGLPLRSELKLERFRDHFKADGILRPDSELGQHKGDPRLFTPLWWEHLLRWQGMCTDTES